MPKRPVHLPGTTLEGGGQLLRNALALSSLTRTPIHITSIRGGRRDGGGLKAQHLSGLIWLAQATSAKIEGARRKSLEVVFQPAAGASITLDPTGAAKIDIGSAGSVFLVFQALLPVLVFGCAGRDTVVLTLRGGATVAHAPSYGYVRQVLLPTLARIGLPPITLSAAVCDGATGLDEVVFTVTPLGRGAVLPAFDIVARGELGRVDVTVEARSEDIRSVVIDEVHASLVALGFSQINTLSTSAAQSNNALHILLVLHTTTACTLATSALQPLSAKKPPNISALRSLAAHTARALRREWDRGACVDQYMQDQLVVFQGLAAGRCRVDAGEDEGGSLHTQTARWVVEKLLGVEWDGRGECEGVGWRAGETWASRKSEKSDGDASADEVEGPEISASSTSLG
jgi:RNA 3'-terminal phosphate cyclase (ATP)